MKPFQRKFWPNLMGCWRRTKRANLEVGWMKYALYFLSSLLTMFV